MKSKEEVTHKMIQEREGACRLCLGTAPKGMALEEGTGKMLPLTNAEALSVNMV